MLDHGEDVVAGPLDAAGRDGGLGVVLGVVDVAVLHVGDVQPGDVAVVTEDPEVGVARDDAGLEDLLRTQQQQESRSRLMEIGIGFKRNSSTGLFKRIWSKVAVKHWIVIA